MFYSPQPTENFNFLLCSEAVANNFVSRKLSFSEYCNILGNESNIGCYAAIPMVAWLTMIIL